MTYHQLFLSPPLLFMLMTLNCLSQYHHSLTAPIFNSMFKHLNNGALILDCLSMQVRVFLLRFCTHSPLVSFNYSLNYAYRQGLGTTVFFSSDLSWSEHYTVIAKNAYNQYNQLYVIKRSFSSVCPPHVKTILCILNSL